MGADARWALADHDRLAARRTGAAHRHRGRRPRPAAQPAHRHRRRLRAPGETGYNIPRGGAFEWISCPNYLGELVEWTGWALASWSPAGLAFAVYTAANLVPRALSHHDRYRDRFPEYPPRRSALIPFLL